MGKKTEVTYPLGYAEWLARQQAKAQSVYRNRTHRTSYASPKGDPSWHDCTNDRWEYKDRD